MRIALLLLLTAAWGCTTTTVPSQSGGGAGTENAENGEAAENGGATGGEGVPSSLSGQIERVGLDFTASLEVEPILLLKDGVACRCLDEDLDKGTVDDVRAKRPKAVGQWRGEGKSTETSFGNGWKKLAFTPSALALGNGWTSSAAYDRTSTVGVAGTDSFVGASKAITFEPSGSFEMVGATGTSSSAATSRSRGTYSVKGWMMTLTFEDGTEQRVSAMTGEDEPERALWLGGAGYSRLKDE